MKAPLHLFAALGFTSMVGQILLMRELVVVFYGNELSLGIMLGSWLLWAGLGSLLAAAMAPRFRVLSRTWAVALLQLLLGLAAVGSLLCVRALPLLLRRATVGEIVGYIPIVVSSFLVLAPLCLFLGFLFALFCHVWSTDEEAAASIGSVYVIEALGAAAGGVVFAAVLVWVLDPVEMALLLLLVNLAAAAATLALESRLRPAVIVASILTVGIAAISYFGGADRLRGLSLGWLWRQLDLVHSEDSIYGNVAFVETEEQKSLYENGLLMFSHPDRFSAEEAVHFALLEHPRPESVLLIGGGIGGSLNEALKHPLTRVDYLELDPLVIEAARRFFPAEIEGALDDARVRVHTVDGRLFVKTEKAKYDVILVNLPDPYTALINRFYTLEFFQECRRRLSWDGILSFRVSSAENYISPELQQFLGCLHATLREVFPDVKVIPGETNIFLACTEPGTLTLDSDVLVSRLDERGIKQKLLFVREYYLPDRLSEERKERVASALETAEARINTDLAPVCYYYDAVLWSKQFKDVSGWMLASFSKVRPGWILAVIAAAFALALLAQRLFPGAWGQKSLLAAVATTGFAEITVEVVTLLGFQAIHGYVYYKVAIIVTAFMLGLTVGGAVMAKAVRSGGAGWRTFLLVQTLVCLYPILTVAALILFSGSGSEGSSAWKLSLQATVAFPLLAFLAGCVGGLQFPLANLLYLGESPGAARAAGYTYGVDLIGSCLGAILTSALLVPVLGIAYACATAAVLNMGSLALLLFRRSD
jgi:spermidine synthase